jgi:hypothetical protein
MNKPIAFIPGARYVPISITGNYCGLMCPFCKGKYLRGMIDASDTERLSKILKGLYDRGVRGFLISGGYNKEGYLEINTNTLKTIERFKNNNEVVISIHLGLAPKHLIDSVWAAGIDFIDFEIPPSNKYINVMKNLKNKKIDDYLDRASYALDLDKEFLIPHIILDSMASTADDELWIIREVSKLKPILVVFLVEIKHGMLGGDLNRVYSSLMIARELYREIAYGCMRPPHFKKYDSKFIEMGLVDRIANPSRIIIHKYDLEVVRGCCSIPRKYFKLFQDMHELGAST